MPSALRITFRHMTVSPALENRIHELFNHLERLHDRVTGCDVVVTAPTSHRQQGAPFGVRIDLTMPARHLHVQNGSANAAHADAHLAVHDVFAAMERMMRRHQYAQHRHRESDSIRTTSLLTHT